MEKGELTNPGTNFRFFDSFSEMDLATLLPFDLPPLSQIREFSYQIFPPSMGNSKGGNKTPKLEVTSREKLVKKVSKSHLTGSYDRRTLKQALRHLLEKKKKNKKTPSKESCVYFDSTAAKIDHQVKLRCRQLPNVVEELRRAIIRQDWDEVTILVTILCNPGLRYYSTIIMRVCFMLLFNHPSSNLSLVKKFIRLTTDYVLEEDVEKFLRILFVLRKESLKPLQGGKYIRKTGDYKVIMDPEFKNL